MTTIYEPSDFGAIGDGVTDDTVAMQAFVDAAKNGRGRMPKRYVITQPIILDPAARHNLYGDGYDASGALGSAIINNGSGDALQLIDSASVGINTAQYFADFCIKGNRWSGNGFTFNNVHSLFIERLFVLAHGGNGIRAVRSCSIKIDDTICVHNSGYGLQLYEQANNVCIRGGAYIDNDRNSGGTANIGITGTVHNENLAVMLQGVDFSSPNQIPWGAPSQSFGLIAQQVWGLSVKGCYAEGVGPGKPIPYLVYADPTCAAMSIENCYFQDGQVLISSATQFSVTHNVFNAQSVPTSLNASTSDGLQSRVFGNAFKNGATKTLSGVSTA